ncbi:MAG TPA: GNAT family N-acetyltransferase [Thermoleophilaceae bacterium]|jgi:CelD/BcsL family acetyltransferase involved in cellulose biosynthesis
MIEEVRELEPLREDWQRLAEAAGSPFSTYEWAETWWRHYGAGRELHLLRCRDDAGRAFAILPLFLARSRPVRILRLVGQGAADQLMPICAPQDADAAAAALHEALRDGLAGWQALIADRLPGEEWAERLGGRALDRTPSPVLEAGGASFDDWLATRSKNFRDQVKRRERKLAKSHELAFRLTDDPARLDEDLGTLIRLHRERWGDASGSFEGGREEFHRDFARVALDRGWLRLWTLELDGRPAASWLGYRFGGDEWYYQAGRDPELEREAVGFVLMAHTVRAALDDGVARYRLLLGGEGYKDRFANADHGLHTTMLGRGVLGQVLAVGAETAATRPALRARLKRFAR